MRFPSATCLASFLALLPVGCGAAADPLAETPPDAAGGGSGGAWIVGAGAGGTAGNGGKAGNAGTPGNAGAGGTGGKNAGGSAGGGLHGKQPDVPGTTFHVSQIACGGALSDAALGDVTGDGVADAVVATGDGGLCIASYTKGVLAVVAGPSLGTAAVAIGVGDVNGDAMNDLVALLGDGTLRLLPGVAGGGFGAAKDAKFPAGSLALAVGDVNGDGKADVLVGDTPGETVHVLLGPDLKEASTFVTYPHPKRIALGDLDGDGKVDVVTHSDDNEGSVPCNGAGDGTFPFCAKYEKPCCVTGGTGHALVVADFDGDGRSDQAASLVGPSIWGLVSNAAIEWTTGPTEEPKVLNMAMGPGETEKPIPSLAAADVDGDGSTEIIATTAARDDVSLWGVNVPGHAIARHISVGLHLHVLRAGDMTGDGKPDVVGVTADGIVVLMKNNGNLLRRVA